MAQGSNNRLRNYTSLPLEIVVVTFTILPFLLLAYFYPLLSDRVPLFMTPFGDVAEWGRKSVFSVFRVPLLGVIMQITFMLMKYGSVQFKAPAPLSPGHAELQEHQLNLAVGLWDWLRWTGALKMTSESVETVFLSVSRFNFLARPAFIATVSVTLIGAAGALVYFYRLLFATRDIKKQFAVGNNAVDAQRVYFEVFYFNPADPALFVWKYGLNFANKLAWVLMACAAVYLLLVFLPGS